MINQNRNFSKRVQKTIAVIGLLCLLIAFSAVTASAASIAASVTVSSVTVERDASASVSFNLEGNPGIWGIKLRIHYDHSVLTLKSVTIGDVFEKGELTLSQSLDKDPYVVVASCNSLENKTTDGTIVTLIFTVSRTAKYKTYPITVEVSQANNVDGNNVSVNSVDGGVTVVDCIHANTEWRVTKAAGCEENGKETLTCKKCGKTFETKNVNATGHKNTEVKNVVAATKTSEGYTGDTYCKTCGKLVKKGQTVAKLKDNTPVTDAPKIDIPVTDAPKIDTPVTDTQVTNTPATDTTTTDSPADPPIIISGGEASFNKDSQKSLVFVSNADFDEFLRVEIDGNALDKKDFTAKSGSTIVTVNKDYLNKLSNGVHTISIVSTSGTATAKFTVQDLADTESTANPDTTNPSQSDLDDVGNKSSMMPKIIAAIVVVVLVFGVTAFLVIKKRRS